MGSYGEGAKRYYDLFGEKDDVDFYVSQALTSKGKVLELGVGTARLAIQLARKGVDTWGVEPSQHMLMAAERNIAKESPEVRSRLHLIHGDAGGFRVSERFNMIYFPSGSFDHILDPIEQRGALLNIKNHLAHGGRYVFDLYLMDGGDKGWFVQRRELPDGSMVVRSGYHVVKSMGKRMMLDMWYEHVVEGRVVERFYEGSEVHVFTVDEVKRLLDETGFKVAEEYGDHHGTPFKKGDNMIALVTYPK